MRYFYDDDHRKWSISITWKKAQDIFNRCERPDSTPQNRKTYDLFNMTDKDQVEWFNLYDPHTGRFNETNAGHLINILYVLCEEQCKEREMTDVEFGEMMMSAVFGRAWMELKEELANFILDPEQRKMFQNLLSLAEGNRSVVSREANLILAEKVTALTAQTIQMLRDKIDPAFDAITTDLAKAAEEKSTTPSSKSSGLSVSTPVT